MTSMTASEMGRKGAKARIKNTTKAQRSAIARAGATARWGNHVSKKTFSALMEKKSLKLKPL